MGFKTINLDHLDVFQPSAAKSLSMLPYLCVWERETALPLLDEEAIFSTILQMAQHILILYDRTNTHQAGLVILFPPPELD